MTEASQEAVRDVARTRVCAGSRVFTSLGEGTVKYVRMAAPYFTTPQAVAVLLDRKLYKKNYEGTIFSLNEVTPCP